jgi:predicted negative regulator of RcsB-dependent stress response
VAANARETEYRTIARLRLAALLLEQKKYDEALKQLDAADAKSFAALVADRRGDVLAAQGKKDEARAAYRAAYAAMDPAVDYRRLVEAKLVALGAAPAASGVAQ